MHPTRSVSARNYEGAADAERIAELINSSRATDGDTRPTVSAATVQSFIDTAWADFDAQRDIHLFFDDELLVAYERTKRETWAGGARAYHVLPFVHSGWRSEKSVVELLEHVYRYQFEYASHDESGANPFLSVVPDPADSVMINALLATGFEPCLTFLSMARRLEEDVEQRELPPGLELRPLQEKHYRSIYAFDRRIMRDGWGVEAPTETHYRWWAEEAFLNPKLWRVAWNGDAIVGTAAGVIGGTWNPTLGGDKAEIRFVRVDPEWRRQGVASALILHCLTALWGRGIQEVVLDVDGANEATAAALYRTLGFEISSRRVAYRRNLVPPA